MTTYAPTPTPGPTTPSAASAGLAPSQVYARPGSTGSIVALKTRYENFIGGDFRAPAKKN